MPDFIYQEPFPLGSDTTRYRLLSKEFVSVGTFEGTEVLKVDPEGLAFLARQAFRDVSFLLRPAHNEKVAAILYDPEASPNDRASPWPCCGTRRSRRTSSSRSARTRAPRRSSGRRASRSGPARATRSSSRRASTRPTRRRTCATRRTRPLDMYEEVNTRDQPPRADRHLRDARGWSTSSSSSPRAAARRTRRTSSRRRRRCSTRQSLENFLVEKMKTLGPPRARPTTWRSSSAEPRAEAVHEDGEARHRRIPRPPAHRRGTRRAGVPRPRDGGEAPGGARTRSASARSSAASISRSTCGSSACRATAPPARSGMGVSCSADRNVKAQDRPGTGSGSRSWSATRGGSSPTSTAGSTSTAS